jgi:3'-5' exoribonuclease
MIMSILKKEIYVRDVKPKTEVHDYFFVKHIAVLNSRDGRPYLNIIASDKTGELECRRWTQAEETFARVKKGQVIHLKGKINFFQNRLQLIVEDVNVCEQPSEDLLDEMVMKSTTSAEVMFDRLIKIIEEELSDVYIRDLLLTLLNEPELKRRLKKWQAGKSVHHAYESGLLEHILSCVDLSLMLARHYKLNHNYVVAGAILHDLCKTSELTEGPMVEYTDEGKLLGHLVKGIELIEITAQRMGFFPADLKLHLKHIVASHHGVLEYGSPKVPHTSEAYLVHLIDYMDSKMNAMISTKTLDSTPGKWSQFIKHLDRIVYKEELPFYPEYVEVASSSNPVTTPSNTIAAASGAVTKEKPTNAPRNDKGPLKQNLGSLLKDFKID